LRETDTLIELNDNLACVIFNFSDSSEGIKAASNLLLAFETHNFAQDVFLSVVNAKDCSNTNKQINKLFNVLEFALSNGMNNIPLNDISLEG